MHARMYSGFVRYDWDLKKAESNLRKHGIDFADAIPALEDDLGLTVEDDGEDEARFVTVGMDVLGRLLVVIYTHREEGQIRIISARKASPRERRAYEGAK